MYIDVTSWCYEVWYGNFNLAGTSVLFVEFQITDQN